MARTRLTPMVGAAFFALTALAACGGGGGGGSTGSGGGGGPLPSIAPTSTPAPTPTATPFSTGQMKINGNAMANATVAFTCGCTQQAGQTAADASGNYSITVPAPMFGGAAGSYTPPGHNLMVIGFAAGSHAQAYTMEFFANSPANDLNLDGNSGANTSDEFTTAAALYIYYQTIQYYKLHPSNDNTYDVWNFRDISTLKLRLAAGGGNAAEQTLIADIKAAQAAGQSLYPEVPSWDHTSGDGVNAQILSDIKNAIATDSNLPQPCGSSCTGTPTP